MESRMKIAVIGAGNIGTAMAALLGGSGAEVTVTARGLRLEQIRAQGVALCDRGTWHRARPQAKQALEQVQDAVFFCVKAQALPQAVAENIAGIGPDTLVIPMVNGLPFWFFAGGAEVPFVDPEAILARHLDPQQVLGAVLLMTVRMEAGEALSSNTPTLSLGPAMGAHDRPAIARLARVLEAGGIRTDVTPTIRQKVLVKLLANITTNPLSALLGDHLATIGQTPELAALASAVADPFRAWARGLGYDLPDNHWLIDLIVDAGDFPTSMLQDARAGRALELDAIARAPMAMAEAAGHPNPALAAILAALDTHCTLPLSGSEAQIARHSLMNTISLERI
ncbi:ketopantoate reductase C-terminal domain-containing protein [Thioclava sp. GXIMD2076]|uniref:ketopantoate reductase family protein n=1 Tax=Thioclava sp. GXIMD2076 TaxID=3131931 RepID=UPI0030CB3752